jgi:hypothetical protein
MTFVGTWETEIRRLFVVWPFLKFGQLFDPRLFADGDDPHEVAGRRRCLVENHLYQVKYN